MKLFICLFIALELFLAARYLSWAINNKDLLNEIEDRSLDEPLLVVAPLIGLAVGIAIGILCLNIALISYLITG